MREYFRLNFKFLLSLKILKTYILKFKKTKKRQQLSQNLFIKNQMNSYEKYN